jgi:hypothetical protein
MSKPQADEREPEVGPVDEARLSQIAKRLMSMPPKPRKNATGKRDKPAK